MLACRNNRFHYVAVYVARLKTPYSFATNGAYRLVYTLVTAMSGQRQTCLHKNPPFGVGSLTSFDLMYFYVLDMIINHNLKSGVFLARKPV